MTDHRDDPLAAMLHRPDMTRRAKGLLIELLTVGREHETIQTIADRGVEGREAVATTVRELESLGYVTRTGQRRDPDTNRWLPGGIVATLSAEEAPL